MRKALGRLAFFAGGVLLASSALAQDEVLNLRLARARNVAIGYETGVAFSGNPPSSEDRDAWYAVRQGIESSGRYWIVSNPKDAELLITVRVRWVLEASGERFVRQHGLAFRGERFPKADILAVYDARSPQGSPLWRGVEVGGLSGNFPPLLAKFEADVAALAKRR